MISINECNNIVQQEKIHTEIVSTVSSVIMVYVIMGSYWIIYNWMLNY